MTTVEHFRQLVFHLLFDIRIRNRRCLPIIILDVKFVALVGKAQRIYHFDNVLFGILTSSLQRICEQELVGCYDLLDKLLPILVTNLGYIKFFSHFIATILNLLIEEENLVVYVFDCALHDFAQFGVRISFDEIYEVLKLKEVFVIENVLIYLLHLKISIFASNKHGECMTGLCVCDIIDVGEDKLEDEHDLIATAKIHFLVFGNAGLHVLTFFSLFDQLLIVLGWLVFDLNYFLCHNLLAFWLWDVLHCVFVYVGSILIELFILPKIYSRC